MVMKYIRKQVTAAATTATGTIGTIYGKILKVEVKNDTGSCGWWIFVDASDIDTASIVDEDILGATGAGHVDTAGAVYYPVVAQVLAAGTTTDPDQYSPPIVGGRLEYNVDDCASGEVLTITIWYEPVSD